MFLGVILACCGLTQINLYRISTNSTFIDFFTGTLILIAIFLGIVRYKIFDNSQEDANKLTLFICLLVIVNIIMFWIYFSFPITDMEGVLAGGDILTLMNFEESTWFLLYNLGYNPDEEIPAS